jgi:DUF2945 family protein
VWMEGWRQRRLRSKPKSTGRKKGNRLDTNRPSHGGTWRQRPCSESLNDHTQFVENIRSGWLRHSSAVTVVEWNSEAGRVRGVILRKVISDVRFKGYVHHASKDEPQYLIKSEKTDHIAIHKGRALKRIKTRTQQTRVRRKKRS